jgi:hypothetical protein
VQGTDVARANTVSPQTTPRPQTLTQRRHRKGIESSGELVIAGFSSGSSIFLAILEYFVVNQSL